MSVFDLAAVLFAAVAVVGWANHKWLRMPHSIGLVVFSLAVGLGVRLADVLVPSVSLAAEIEAALRHVDFHGTLMHGMLGFLLFAGASHMDMRELARQKGPVAVMATVGVVVSTLVVGVLLWACWAALGQPVPMSVCFVFGALISATDPIAVLAILKVVKVPPSLEAKIAGESLFNDGVAVVAFTAAVAFAASALGVQSEPPSAAGVAALFAREAVGGAALGAATGWVAYRLMRAIDDHPIEIMVTLALVTGTMTLGRLLHVSGPIAVVVAGLIIGSVGKRKAMSENTRQHLGSFWSVLDEVLNSVLFLLLGLWVVVIHFEASHLLPAAAAVPAVLAARLVSVGASLQALRRGFRMTFSPGSVKVLTWGGLRGAISVAMALSLPEGGYKPLLLSVTYVVVIFSVVVQGLTVKRVILRSVRGPSPAEA